MGAVLEIESLLGEAAAAGRGRDFERCRLFANRVVGLDRGNGAALHFLALSALHLRRGGELLAVLGHCQAISGNAAALFNGVLRSLIDARDLGEIEFALEAVPQNNACWIVAKYYRGCADIVRGAHEPALRHFTEFRRLVPVYGPAIDFMDAHSFNVMFRQGVTVGDGETVAKRLAGEGVPGMGTGLEV